MSTNNMIITAKWAPMYCKKDRFVLIVGDYILAIVDVIKREDGKESFMLRELVGQSKKIPFLTFDKALDYIKFRLGVN